MVERRVQSPDMAVRYIVFICRLSTDLTDAVVALNELFKRDGFVELGASIAVSTFSPFAARASRADI